MATSALLNYDVLLEILSVFLKTAGPLVGDPKAKRYFDLAQCARVSKAFNEVANRILWRRLPSVKPLLDLLELQVDTGYVSHMQGTSYDGEPSSLPGIPALNYVGTIGVPALKSFCRYSVWVQVIAPEYLPGSAAEHDEPVYIMPPVWQELSRLKHTPLLPALRSLEWNMFNATDNDLFLLIPPTLRRLHLSMYQSMWYSQQLWDGMMLTLGRQLAHLAPSLTHFTASTPAAAPIHGLFYEFWRYGSLKVIDLGRLPPSHAIPVHNLSNFQLEKVTQLEEMTIALIVDHSEERPSTKPCTHPTLQSLSIVDFAWHSDAITIFRTPAVRTLRVNHRLSSHSPVVYEPIASAIAHTFPALTAFTLEFAPSKQRIQFRAKPPPFTRWLEPLLTGLTGLTDVDLHFSPIFSMADDASVAALVEAWPRLARLRLRLSQGRAPARRWVPGIGALVGIARDARRLRELRLSHLHWRKKALDTALKEEQELGAEEDGEEGSRTGRSLLELLEVETCIIEKAQDFSLRKVEFFELLERLFPHVDNVRSAVGVSKQWSESS